jgi:hypothetical protein
MRRAASASTRSPPWIKETLEQYEMDATHGQPAADAAKVYVASRPSSYPAALRQL